mgnify:CR=1 FL=1
MTLGQKLRQAREEAGLSQRQPAGTEMTRDMLSQLEHDTARPSMRSLCYLAGRLGKSVSYFLEDGTVTSLISKEEAQAHEINELVEEKFQGSLPAFVAAFTKRQDISKEELDEVQRMIDRIRNGG